MPPCSPGRRGVHLIVTLACLASVLATAHAAAAVNVTTPTPSPTKPPPLPFTPRDTWTLLAPYTPGLTPRPRRYGTLTLVDKNATVLFGGRREVRNGTSGEVTYTYFNDVWLFNTTTGTWKELYAQRDDPLVPTDHPSGRFGHGAAALDRRFLFEDRPAAGAPNYSLIIYGGASPLCFDFCSDMWEFRLDSLVWRALPPSAFRIRSDGSDSTAWLGRRWRAIMWSFRNFVFVYGGFRSFNDPDELAADTGYLDDLWEIDFRAGAVLDADGRRIVRPPVFLVTRLYPAVWGGLGPERLRRTGAAYAFDPARGLFLFGGYKTNSSALQVGSDSIFYDDLWMYDHDSNMWYPVSQVNVTRPAPTARGDAVMFIHDEVIGIYGGMDRLGIVGGDIWYYNTTTNRWLLFDVKSVSNVGPSPGNRTRHTGVTFFDHRALIFGGVYAKSDDDEGDTWLLDLRACRSGCSGYGRCYKGHCVCESNSYLVDCSGTLCPDASCYFDYVSLRQVCTQCTMGRGLCDGRGNCLCSAPASGLSCELTLCLADCRPRAWVKSLATGDVVSAGDAPFVLKYGRISGWDRDRWTPYANGFCEVNGTCTCEPSWAGLDCSLLEGCMDPRATNFDAKANSSRADLCTFPPGSVIEPLIPIEVMFATDLEGFLTNNSAAAFRKGIAEYMNTDLKRVAVTKIRRGSVIVTFSFTDAGEVATSAASSSKIQLTALSALRLTAAFKVQLRDSKEYAKLQGIFSKYSDYLTMMAISKESPVAVSMPQTTEARAAETLEREDFLTLQGVSTKTTTSASGTKFMFLFAFVWLGVIVL